MILTDSGTPHQPHLLSNSSSFSIFLVAQSIFFPPAAQVYHDISTGGVFEEGGLDRSHIFLTIHDAVLFALANAKGVFRPPVLEEVQMILDFPLVCRIAGLRSALSYTSAPVTPWSQHMLHAFI